jgi:hypothetical protein
MTTWTDRLRSHRVRALLPDLDTALDTAIEKTGNDAATIDGLARLKAVLAFSEKRVEAMDPLLQQVAVLDQLATHVEGVGSHVRAFTENGDSAHLNNAQSNADGMLGSVALLNLPRMTGDVAGMKKATEAYRAGLDAVLRDASSRVVSVTAQVDGLAPRAAELAAETAAERARVQTMSAEFQSQFSTGQDARQRDYADAQNERQVRFQDAVAEHATRMAEQSAAAAHLLVDAGARQQAQLEAQRQEHTDAQADRQTQFAELAADYSSKLEASEHAFSSLMTDATERQRLQLAELRKTFVDAATALRAEMDVRKKEIEKLVGVIGNLGVTSGYLTTANEAKKTTQMWQLITVSAMIGFIGMAFYSFLPSVQGSFSWPGFAGRVFVSLSVGVLAAYAGAQADRSQKVERHNRRLALELEAIGPFIAPLPVEKQEAFRLAIGERSFGHGDGASSGGEKSPTSVADLLKSDEFSGFIQMLRAAKS